MNFGGRRMKVYKKYIDIDPEYREEFIEGVTAYFQHKFEDIKALNHKISRLIGTQYSYEQEKSLEKTVVTSKHYARFLLGELNEKMLTEECIRSVMDNGQTFVGMLTAKMMMLTNKSKIGDFLSQETLKKEVKIFKRGIRIAEREKISLKEVFDSEEFNFEISRVIYRTVKDKRDELLSVLDEKMTWFPMEEIDIKNWVTDDLIDPKGVENLKWNLRHYPHSARSRAYKIAVIIVNEEDIVKIYGDSANQKLKRKKLYEVMEYMRSKA